MSLTDIQKAHPASHFDLFSPQSIDKTYKAFELKGSKYPGRVILTFLDGYIVDHLAISEFEQKLLLAK